MHVAYPGLPRPLASKGIIKNAELSFDELINTREERTLALGYTYSDLNDRKMSPNELLDSTRAILDIFDEVTGSKKFLAKGTLKVEFDRQVTKVILDVLPMNTYEASLEESWSFITIRPLAEIAIWRFPTEGIRENWERYLGLERNTFKRLWWRAHMLGPDLASSLKENELIQMFERGATVGSNKLIMERISLSALENRDELEQLGGKSSDFITECAKRLRRTLAIQSLELMTHDEQVKYVDSRIDEALETYRIKRSK
jgi:hypothetical protein